MAPPTTVGAVLVGGASTRMGADKATLDVGGAPLGARAVAALRDAGIDDVMLVGATPEHVAALGARGVDDIWPGEGPVGGVLTALHAAFMAGATEVVCLACDLPAVTGADVTALREAAVPRRITLPAVDGRTAPPNGVWPVPSLVILEDRFGEGASSFGELLEGVDADVVAVGPGFTDADEPGDLAPFR